jgi:uncharacterized protein (TIGR02268 family)
MNPPALLFLPLLVPALAASAADAPGFRELLISGQEQTPPEIHVTSGEPTLLRFNAPVDPERTRLGACADGFEPLVITGGTLLLQALGAVDGCEHVPLSVVLEDGSEFSLALVLRPEEVDLHVRIRRASASEGSAESPRAEHTACIEESASLREENARLRVDNRRCRRQQEARESTEAALLRVVSEAEEKGAPILKSHTLTYPLGRMQATVTIYHAAGYMALHVRVTDTAVPPKQPWKLGELRLTRTTGDAGTGGDELKLLALRAESSPSSRGNVAHIDIVVADIPKGEPVLLRLELTEKDGSRHLLIENLKPW